MLDVSGKLPKWHVPLSEFEFDVVHPRDFIQQVAHALSRVLTKGADENTLEGEVPVHINGRPALT